MEGAHSPAGGFGTTIGTLAWPSFPLAFLTAGVAVSGTSHWSPPPGGLCSGGPGTG